MRKQLLLFSLSITSSVITIAQDVKPVVDSASVKIIFAGDVMGHGPQIQAAFDSQLNEYKYDTSFYFLKPFLSSADITLANLEVTLSGPPYSGYPHFSSPDALAAALKRAGFQILVTANNHAADRGAEGINRTLHILDSVGLLHTGTFHSRQERDSISPLIVEKKGMHIAFLNYTYGTNGETVPYPYVVNLIDTALIRADIDKARLKKADYIIAIMHWGNEYERFASNEQKSLARWIIMHGCDMIIGSHPHVIQGVEFIVPDSGEAGHPKLVLYSLGNLISNQRDRYKNGGILFGIKLIKSNTNELHQYAYLPVWVYKISGKNKPGYYMITPQAYISNHNGFGFSETIEKELNEFFEDTRVHMKIVPEMIGPDW